MNPPPLGWPRCAPSLFYDDAPAALAQLVEGLGFTERVRVEDPAGRIVHAELVFDDAVVMVSSAGRHPFAVSPRSLGGRTTQSLFFYVDNLDAHVARARAGGLAITQEPSEQDYGEGYWRDRSYRAEDREGHVWWFAERLG